MTNAQPDPFANLEAGLRAEPFAVGFRKSDGEALVYGTLLLGAILVITGIFAAMPLISAAALVPLSIAFWHYPMLDKSVPQLGANKDGLFVERLGFIDWGAISALSVNRSSVRSIQLAHLDITLTRPVKDALAKPQTFPFWKRLMMRNWTVQANLEAADRIRIQLHPLNADPGDVVARIKAFRPVLENSEEEGHKVPG